MRAWRYGAAVVLLAGLGACSNIMGGENHTASAPPPATATAPTVAPNMVKEVQSKLRDDGYYKQGSVDGVWGSGTEAAVRSFQKDHNLSSNGQLDVPTLQALNVAGAPNATSNTAPAQPASPTQPMGSNANPAPADNTAAPAAH